MKEMMLALETLDTRPSAVVLSIGAVIFSTGMVPKVEPGATRGHMELGYEIEDRFYRILDISEQLGPLNRTVSQSTLLWWMRQDQDALAEAFGTNRVPLDTVMVELQNFVDSHASVERTFSTMDLRAEPLEKVIEIWNHLANDVKRETPWRYNNV